MPLVIQWTAGKFYIHQMQRSSDRSFCFPCSLEKFSFTSSSQQTSSTPSPYYEKFYSARSTHSHESDASHGSFVCPDRKLLCRLSGRHRQYRQLQCLRRLSIGTD